MFQAGGGRQPTRVYRCYQFQERALTADYFGGLTEFAESGGDGQHHRFNYLLKVF
jgi:hypothetical protein